MIIISKDKYGQGERIARIIHLLVTEGAKSYFELREKFPMYSNATLGRDIKLLKKTGMVVERKEARTVGTTISRKVFIFFKDNRDVVGKIRKTIQDLKKEYSQITLDQIASRSGFPPRKVEEEAYSLASKLDMLIGKDPIQRPPDLHIAGAQKN